MRFRDYPRRKGETSSHEGSGFAIVTCHNSEHPKLLQLGVFGFGRDEDGNIEVGVFPKGEEILIGSFRFGGVTLQHIGTSKSEMGERLTWLSPRTTLGLS